MLLFGVAGYVLVEAAAGFGDPPDVASLPVLVVGVDRPGRQRRRLRCCCATGAKESLNVRGAYLEVVADTLGSIGVIVAAVVMRATGWGWVDPVVGAAIGVFILPRAWRLGRDALRVLVQAAPAGIDLDAVRADLPAIAGRGRRPRPARVDADQRDGRAHRPPVMVGGRHRRPGRARPGPPAAARPLRARPRHPPGRARRPRGCEEVTW